MLLQNLLVLSHLRCELCQGKMCLKIFVAVIPKEGFLLWKHPSLGMTPTTNYTFFGYDTDYTIVLCCFHRLHSVVLAIPKEGLAGPAHQSSFGYDNDKDLTARFPMTHLMCHLARDETVVCDTLMLHFNITLHCLATHVTVWELSQISLSLWHSYGCLSQCIHVEQTLLQV